MASKWSRKGTAARRASSQDDGQRRGRGRAVVDGGVLGSDAMATVTVGMERRRGGRWSIKSRGSDCTKGVDSGRWATAWVGVEFGRGGRGQK